MKRKTNFTEMWKRGMSIALTCAMTVSLLPAFSLSASAAETELLKAGSIPASEATLTYEQPMASGTAGSTHFRIPAFISVDNGEYRGNLVAAADARYTTTVDGGGLDTIASVSEDMGKTWHYSFPIYFPDSAGYAGVNATTAIDPALVEGKDGTIYCLADMNPTGITTYFGQVNQGTGYVEIDGVDRLVLTSTYSNANTLPTAEDKTTYEYYIGDFDENGYAPVLKRADNTPSGYGVDEWYNLYHVTDGNYVADLTQAQVNDSSTTIQQNAFYKDSVLHVYNTGYIWMVKSTDGGWTWEDPTILNPQIKRTDGEYALLVSPGKGTTLKNGTIIIPFYDHGDAQENVSFIYSKDNGQNWKRTNDVSGNWTSESELVELEDGTLRMFSRTGTGKIAYADATMNEEGDYTMGSLVQTSVAVTSTCNVTASVYSKKINGKEAILVACPSGPSRANGKIYTFLVNEDKSMELHATYAIPDEGYGTNYAYSCLDEQTDGTIGLFYEPNGSPQRCIYTSIDMADITSGTVETKVEVSADAPYVTTYNQVAAEGNITQQPDSDIATVTVAHNTVAYSGNEIYSYNSEVASSLTAFADEADSDKTVADCEFTITSTGTNTYTVQSVKTQKYWNTQAQATYFGDTATDLKIQPTTADGNTTFRVCLSSSGQRYSVFYPTKMIFDAYTNYSDTAPVDFELVFMEKKEAAEEGDLIPGYQRATSITSGNKYLIGCFYGGSYVVLYPTNGTKNHTKLIRTGTYQKTTLTIAKGTKNGVTTAVVDGTTYKILADTELVRLGKGSSMTIDAAEGETYQADAGLTVTQSEAAKALLYDHEDTKGSTGFSATANENLSLSAAEMEFTSVEGSENTFTVKGKNGWYLSNAAAGGGYWKSTAQNLVITPVSGETGAYEFCTSGTTRHLCFFFTQNNFNANSSKSTFDGSYSLLVLEKKNEAAADDVIPGYQKASSIVSGKSYLVAYKAEDGSVYVLYPVAQASGDTVMNLQTKKYEKQTGSRLVVTGAGIGSANLTVGGKLYIVNVVCLHKHLKTEGAVEATCGAAGATGKITCTDCNEVLSESVAVARKGHWYLDGVVTKEPTATETGVRTYTCGLDSTHTKTEEIPTLTASRAELAEKLTEAAAELEKTGMYTEESLAALQTAYDAAAAVTDTTAESEVAAKLAALKTALENLRTPVQKAEEELQTTVSTADPAYEAGAAEYTAESWAAFESAYKAAKNPPAGATADQLEALKADLEKTYAALEKRNLELEGAQAKRQAALSAAKTVYDAGQGSYTAATWTAFKTAYEALTAAGNSTDIAELTKLAAALTDAQSKLVKEVPGGSTPTPDPGSQDIVIGKIYDSGNYYYKVTGETTAQVTGLKNKKITRIVIYNTVTLGGKKYNVTSVAPSAFKGNKKITSVTVKKGILDIGKNAFAGCTKLKKVTIKSTTLKSIGAKAFYNCKKLNSIVIKSKALKKVGKNAFKGISKKAVIKVPAAKLKAYSKVLAKKGQSKTVKIKK